MRLGVPVCICNQTQRSHNRGSRWISLHIHLQAHYIFNRYRAVCSVCLPCRCSVSISHRTARVLSLSYRTVLLTCLGARLMGIELLMFDLGLCHLPGLMFYACAQHVFLIFYLSACLGARFMGIELLMFYLGLCHLSWHACTYHVVCVLIFKLRPLGNWVMRVGFKRSKRGNNRLCNTTPRRMPQTGRRCQQWSCPNIPQPFSYCCCCI